MGKKIYTFPVNRVEGDLEIRIELTNGIISDAWSVGTMYRGIENIMTGRSPMDSLVITPRVCGICSTSHLKAAAKALDMFYNVEVPDTAKKIRNIALGVEMLQNDMRQSFLVFMCDFANPYYKSYPLFEEAFERYQPLKGKSALNAVTSTANIIEIIAILGGQWPHSSFIIPGGVASAPGINNINQCIFLLNNYRKWYEEKVLGCSIEKWSEIKSRAELEAWLHESDAHWESELGFYIRFSRDAGLDKIGKSHGNFISFGSMEMPENTEDSSEDNNLFLPAGFALGTRLKAFQQEKITEDSAFSWFNDEGGPLHPFDGHTIPYATGGEGEKYSWVKAPRYDGFPAETGPLAQMIISKNTLFTDIFKQEGDSVFIRELARIVRPALILPVLKQWIKEIAHDREEFFNNYQKTSQGFGFGLIEAPRGALGHWVKIIDEKIEKYQIITPTAWNASPRDFSGIRGPWEEALIGTPIKNTDNPIEAGHVIRSFDPCLVCAVHFVSEQ